MLSSSTWTNTVNVSSCSIKSFNSTKGFFSPPSPLDMIMVGKSGSLYIASIQERKVVAYMPGAFDARLTSIKGHLLVKERLVDWKTLTPLNDVACIIAEDQSGAFVRRGDRYGRAAQYFAVDICYGEQFETALGLMKLKHFPSFQFGMFNCPMQDGGLFIIKFRE